MTISITNFVDVNVTLAGATAERFSFGKLLGVFEHSATSNRFDGPYTSVAEGVEAGFTSTDEPEVHAWLTSVFAQASGVDAVYVGRIDSGDADLTESLDFIEAEAGEDAWYFTTIESRLEADIILAAAWHEARRKFFIAQTSDVLGSQVAQVTFAGVTNTVGDSTIRIVHGDDVDFTLTRTSAGSETSAQIATAIFTAWNLNATAAALAVATNPSSGVVRLTFVEPGITYTVTGTHTGGTATPSTTTPPTGDIGDRLSLAGYHRSAPYWHVLDDAAEGTADGGGPGDGYLDGAAASDGGGFNLDTPGGVGTWAFRELSGITGDTISSADAADFYSKNVNLYARVKGLTFTSKGTAASGRFIDVTTSLDWLAVRIEEAVLSAFVGAATKIPFTNAGINIIRAAVQAVLDAGVSYGHLSPDTLATIDMPDVLTISAAAKATRELTFSVNAVLAGAIHKATITVTVQQ
jgi:hypothetical protein